MSLQCLVPDQIWHAQQALSFGPLSLTTRMTVVRLRDGSLWVHSPISPAPSLLGQLAALGTIRYVVAPNKSHHLFFLPFLEAHPSAEGFIAPGLEGKRPELARFRGIPSDPPWCNDLQGYFIEGLPIINETAWYHAASGTLILTDLLFCFSPENRGLASLAARILGVRGKLGMSRTMKLATRDKRALARSVQPLLSLPVQRVVVGHDQVIEDKAGEKLAQAFAWLG